MTMKLYHNPRCSKSREALKLLQERGHTPEIVHYLDQPPSAAELRRIVKLLGIEPRELLRTKETAYKVLGLDAPRLSDAAIIEAMVANPVLIERPILVSGTRAVLGRPPERVLDLVV